jgi:L-ascorbate peroxidase
MDRSLVRSQRLAAHLCASPVSSPDPHAAQHTAQLQEAASMIRALLHEKRCAPIMLRLAWHDAGTYDQNLAASGAWPAGNGAIGTIRLGVEMPAGPNAGLDKAVGYLKPVKSSCPLVSWADLIQMGGALGVEVAGGPKIDMLYGRIDGAATPASSSEPFGLPDALPPFGGPPSAKQDPAAHLRYVFNKYDNMGDREIVALSGAHTVGRAFADRSGAVSNGYTSPTAHTAKDGMGMKGGRSWTADWLAFNNSYFTERAAAAASADALTAFPTDQVLMTDPGFAPFFQRYALSQADFFTDYALAHKKLSELGSLFCRPGGIRL